MDIFVNTLNSENNGWPMKKYNAQTTGMNTFF